jgi:hypothetical protein
MIKRAATAVVSVKVPVLAAVVLISSKSVSGNSLRWMRKPVSSDEASV